MIIHSLERNSKSTYIYRLYPEEGTLRYVFSMPISYRGYGEWEAHAWNSIYKLWPAEKSRPKLQDLLLWIYYELEHKHKSGKAYKILSNTFHEVFGCKRFPYFEKLTAVFETDRLAMYRRLFRNYFKIVIIYDITKEYNGTVLKGHYVEFIPLSKEKT